MNDKNEIILYQTSDLSIKLDVRVEDDTIWLTQGQIVTLFDSSKANISEHIKHIFETNELENSTVRKIRTVRQEGGRTVSRDLVHYNLDMIVSIGYRVNSIRGTQFRIWATKVLRDYLLKGYSVNKRINRVEDQMEVLTKKVDKIDLQLNTTLPPNQGVFFDGQIFDAYTLVGDIIRKAKRSIVLIDNYVDDSVLTLFSKKAKGVKCTVFTKNISKQLKLDAEKFNKQYGKLSLQQFNKSHDRFLIIDGEEVYHIGASLKDLGKKWFAFSKMDRESVSSLLKEVEEML
jgi:hypothetical protein